MKLWEYIIVGVLSSAIVGSITLGVVAGVRSAMYEKKKEKEKKRRMQMKFNYLRQKYPELETDELWETAEKQVDDDIYQEKEQREIRIRKLRFEDNYRGPSDSVH